jgi:outer membrane immunogenic protein
MAGRRVSAFLLCGALIGSGTIACQAQTAAPAAYDGPYLGLEFGAAYGSSKKDFISTTTGEYGIQGVVGGADAGYDWTFDRYVVGIGGDISASDVRGRAHAPNPAYTYQTFNHFIATLRPRFGYLVGSSTLPYVTAGVATGDVEVQSYRNRPGGVDHTCVEPGWTVGAGIETGLPWSNWRAKAEYLYVDLDKAQTASDVGGTTSTSFRESLIRVGLDYVF